MSLLPTFMEQTIASQTEEASVLPVPVEYGMDFETGQLTGQTVSGIEAIKVWVWLCLQTQRFRFSIYSWNYGCDFEQYIGVALSDEYLSTDARDEIQDALCVSPYITGIENFRADREGDRLTLSFRVATIYGLTEEMSLYV